MYKIARSKNYILFYNFFLDKVLQIDNLQELEFLIELNTLYFRTMSSRISRSHKSISHPSNSDVSTFMKSPGNLTKS